MSVKYLRDQRHAGTVKKIAELKFPFPNEEEPGLETILNLPTQSIAVGKTEDGRDLFPDIVVVKRPGQWLQLMVEVETADSVNDESALNDWLPMSRVGDLLIYVPAGHVAEVKRLCRTHGIHPKGFRTWRFVPVWGLRVAEA